MIIDEAEERLFYCEAVEQETSSGNQCDSGQTVQQTMNVTLEIHHLSLSICCQVISS